MYHLIAVEYTVVQCSTEKNVYSVHFVILLPLNTTDKVTFVSLVYSLEVEYLVSVQKVWGSILCLVYLFFINYDQLQLQQLLSVAFAAFNIHCKCRDAYDFLCSYGQYTFMQYYSVALNKRLFSARTIRIFRVDPCFLHQI